jgi:hypothetical protein
MNPARTPSAAQWTLPHEGTIDAALDDGRVAVTLDGLGPIEATMAATATLATVAIADLHVHDLEQVDPAGRRCLVVFADGRQDRAWVVAVA